MNGENGKGSLADRTEAILRSDRHALRRAGFQPPDPGILLALVPKEGPIADLMDSYIQEITDMTGLRYLRPDVSDLESLPKQVLARTFLVLADLTGRDEHVVTQVYLALALGRRVLISTQNPTDVPRDLVDIVPMVQYGLEKGKFDDLVREVMARATSSMNGEVVAQ